MDEELRSLLRQVQEKLAAEAEPSPAVSELCSSYQRSPEYLALRSRVTEAGRIKHLVRLLGVRPAADLTLLSLDDYRRSRSIEAGRKKDTKTTPASRNREVVRLARILNWAAERKLIPRSPFDSVPLEPEENTRRTSVEPADVEKMLEACVGYKSDPRINETLAAMIATKYDSGLRRGEVVLLRRPQLLFRDGAIELHELDTKARRGRVTLLADRSASRIRALVRDVRFKDSPYVFLTTRGKPYHPRTFLRMAQEVAELAGFEAAPGERFVVHDLRGGFVGEQLGLGTPEREIMDMGGWSTREVFDRYNRRRGAGAVARAKARVDEARKGPQKSEPASKTSSHSQSENT